MTAVHRTLWVSSSSGSFWYGNEPNRNRNRYILGTASRSIAANSRGKVLCKTSARLFSDQTKSNQLLVFSLHASLIDHSNQLTDILLTQIYRRRRCWTPPRTSISGPRPESSRVHPRISEAFWRRPNPSKTLSDLDSLVISLNPKFSNNVVDLSFLGGKKHTKRPSFAQSAPQALATGTITLALTGRSNSELIARSWLCDNPTSSSSLESSPPNSPLTGDLTVSPVSPRTHAMLSSESTRLQTS